MEKKTIVFYAYMTKRLEELIDFAKYFENDFKILFLIKDDIDRVYLDKTNIDYVCLHCNNYVKPFSLKLLDNKYIAKFLNSITHLSIGQYIKEKIYYSLYKTYSKMSEEILIKYNIKLVITLADKNVNPIEIGLLKTANILNIPIFLPYIASWNPEANYQMIENNRNYSLTSSSSLYQKLTFPKYNYQKYKEKYYYQAFLFNVLSRLKVLSHVPWLNGGGASDIVAVSNKSSFDYHVNMGIKKDKLKILGYISYIPLYDIYKNKITIKNKIISKYKLSNSKIMIISLSNWWEHNMADAKTHWQIVSDTIEPLLKYKDKYSILISLHPSMQLDNYIFLEKKYGVTILEERLMNILAIADIYVADFSSTVSWAIICGIKTIIINYFVSLDIYEQYTSILYAKNKEELSNQIKYLINNDISFEHDWNLLSRDKVFNNNIIQQYTNTFNEIIQ